MRLAEALDQSATATLRRVATAHGLAHDDGTTRAELIERLGERLADAAYLEQQLARLTDDQRSVLVAAHASNGELRGLLVDSEHPGAAEDLAESGWLFRIFAAAGPLRGEVYVVPDELRAVLPEPPDVERLPAQEPAPAEPRWTDPAFSLFALVSAECRPGDQLEQDVRGWSEEPGGFSWEARWKFLHHLALSAGFLVHRADGVLAPSPGLARRLDDRHALAERLWRSYLRDRAWSELEAAGLEAERDLVDGAGLRQAMADVLDQLPEAASSTGWLRLEALSRWLEHTRPTLVREQLTPRGVVRFQGTPWSALEWPLLRHFALGPLYWLGQISASRDGRLVGRRAAAWFGVRAAAGSPKTTGTESADACRWEAPAELVAPARARLGTLLQAERYLVLRERGRVSRYHLVQAHVAAALGAGGSLDECRRLLRVLTQTDLPEAVQERLSAWDQRFGALEVRPAVLLEARSEDELDAALADERTRPFLRGRLAPTLAEVAAADALELAAALRAGGHLPRVDAALRLAAEPRRAYAGLVDEQVLEFLLVNLLACQTAWPERLAELEGSTALLERLEHQFPPARLAELRMAADRLAGVLERAPRPAPARRRSRASRRRR